MPVAISPSFSEPPSRCDSVWRGATLVTMQDGHYNLIENGAIAVAGGKIVWTGPAADCPVFAGATQHEFSGGIITPGFVDCHTHLVFGGDRSAEFEQRLNGVSYAEIAAAGGEFSPPSMPPARPPKMNFWLRRCSAYSPCWPKA